MRSELFQAAVDTLLTAISVEFARGTSAACRRTAHLLRSIDTTISTEPIEPVSSHDTSCSLPDSVLELLETNSPVPTVSEIAALTQDLQWSESARSRTPISCLLYTSPSPRDGLLSRMPSSA